MDAGEHGSCKMLVVNTKNALVIALVQNLPLLRLYSLSCSPELHAAHAFITISIDTLLV